MTTLEFSNMFDTLLNSYNSLAVFGETYNKVDIVLDEYEKSVLLTQALDIVVKSYFVSQSNSLGEGFDDSSRRLVDFSSLITVASSDDVIDDGNTGDEDNSDNENTDNDINNPDNSTDTNEYIYNITVVVESDTYIISGKSSQNIDFNVYANKIIRSVEQTSCTIAYAEEEQPEETLNLTEVSYSKNDTLIELITLEDIQVLREVIEGKLLQTIEIILQENPSTAPNEPSTSTQSARIVVKDANSLLRKSKNQDSIFDDRGILFSMPKNILIILNEKVIDKENNKRYVVVPINYKEYDRQMSKAYNQPLKKQCWRLFQSGAGFDILSEIIPIEGVTVSEYRIRYIRRPRPIILADLSLLSLDALEIDGYLEVTECELNPVLHMEILNKAVELALTTRGRVLSQPERQL